MYYQIGKFDPPNQFIGTCREKNITNLVKQYMIQKLHKMNAVLYIQIFTQLKNEWNKIKWRMIKIKIQRYEPSNHTNNDFSNTQHEGQQYYLVCLISQYKWNV